jgi:hypothetical protein
MNLLKHFENEYHITHRCPFKQEIKLQPFFDTCFEFAYQMTFGKQGEHRNQRSGGQANRKNGEIFANAFQGKLAEFGLYQLIKNHGITIHEPDTQLWKLGVWDDADLTINDKKINVKSAAHFSNLLLLETKDWDINANYIPNKEQSISVYDYFIFTRISPDCKSILKKERLLFSNQIERDALYKLLQPEQWFLDCPGFLTLADLQKIIINQMILPQNALLNGKVKMDASNYYCQAGDLKKIDYLINQLKI